MLVAAAAAHTVVAEHDHTAAAEDGLAGTAAGQVDLQG